MDAQVIITSGWATPAGHDPTEPGSLHPQPEAASLGLRTPTPTPCTWYLPAIWDVGTSDTCTSVARQGVWPLAQVAQCIPAQAEPGNRPAAQRYTLGPTAQIRAGGTWQGARPGK